MRPPRYLQNVLIGATAALVAGGGFIGRSQPNGPVLTAAVAFVSTPPTSAVPSAGDATGEVAASTALSAFSSVVTRLSDSRALATAFRGYFAYKAAHPADVKKPYLYFVDYGLPSTAARGYLFDMQALTIVDGPFTVAHGRGSSAAQFGVPTRFSNALGSAATSLGLYIAQETYAFHGKTAGSSYSSLGLRLMGVSTGFNDDARARGVVAHGAPYVTPTRAGRSEGCPAVEPARAQTLLPKLANGGMVFLYAPDQTWLAGDPWVAAGNA